MDPAAPPLAWSNRQRGVPAARLQFARACRIVGAAWPDVLAAERAGSVLPGLAEVHFVLVSDRRIAALHGEFMGDPSPTDVITFLHGEVVISAETALREARARGLPPAEELARYAVHGLLHLAGWLDSDPEAAAEMRQMQEKILRRAGRRLC
jgi:probable rRNA maturation factor